MSERREITILDPAKRLEAENSGVSRLKMSVWYDPEIPSDSQFGENLTKVLLAIGCNLITEDGILRTPEGIIPGQDIRYATRKMFKNADLVHVVLSRLSMSSRSSLYMPGLRGLHEVSDMQVPENIFVVPIKLDDTPLPNMFSGLTSLDLFQNDYRSLGSRLLKTWQVAAKQRGYNK